MAPTIRTRPSFPLSQPLPSGSFHKPLTLSIWDRALREDIREQTDWNHNHGQLANLITWTTALSNSMKLTQALQGHPRLMDHGEKVWQNVVHWRMEWQTNSVFLPWEHHEVWKGKKDRKLKDELPRSIGAQYATGDQWRNNFRKNEGMQPKQKQHPAVDGTGDRSKVQCYKEQ